MGMHPSLFSSIQRTDQINCLLTSIENSKHSVCVQDSQNEGTKNKI